MIYLEIIKSSDTLSLGLYPFEFNQVFIGRSKQNDIIILDKDLPLHFLTIRFVYGKLIVQSFNEEPYFFINDKKISGTLKLKENDIIAFGSNQIKVISYAENTDDFDFAKHYEDFNKKCPELRFALEYIETVLVESEKDQNV